MLELLNDVIDMQCIEELIQECMAEYFNTDDKIKKVLIFEDIKKLKYQKIKYLNLLN